MKRNLFFVLALLLLGTAAKARERQCFDADWRFLLADSAEMSSPDYSDAHWRTLSLPHDWAIEGDFYAGNPSGAGGGALPGGIGWYRKTLSLSAEALQALPRTFLEFDGVYMNAHVFVNGQEIYYRPYGYSSFEVDITAHVHPGDNTIAVRVDNSDQPNSRWYSGCGIYRHVWLTRTAACRIAHWGVHAASSVEGSRGQVSVSATLDGAVGSRLSVEHALIAPDGRVVARAKGLQARLSVSHPQLWHVYQGNIYKVRTRLLQGSTIVDELLTPTGFRSFHFDAQTGFWLNGQNLKLNGVCEHHDFGCLGAALSEDALHRKLTRLKAMGVNAIRSSHNPPAPELLEMCDSMGLIVMDESFDMWRRKKTQNDYARFFDEWHERDLSDLVLRDRNHPSILMWSIGNEVLEQWSSAEADTLTLEQANLILNAGHDASTLAQEGELSVQSLLTRHLAEIVKRLDTSRPILAGCNEPSPNNHLFRSGAIDVIGFNYHHQWVKDVPQNFPGKPFIFSESVSALQTRGYYMMPSDSIYVAPKAWWLPYTDPTYMCSAYDNMHASWSSTHEETWDVVKHTPYVGGQFIWTGFDYIGEPTPYGFPARSSYFGIIDLAGFPKDSYYMYQSEWTDNPMLHLFPHWNWLPGQTIDLWAYYNQADEVELFINGRSKGVRRKGVSSKDLRREGVSKNADDKLCTEYHVGWRVEFEPGEIRAVSRKDGQTVCEQTIRTAGAPDHIRLSVDYAGETTTFVAAEVVDKDGNLCPRAEDQITFSADGDAEIIATDNGCQTSMQRFTSPQRKAFFGKCMVVVKGKGTLKAQSYSLKDATIAL